MKFDNIINQYGEWNIPNVDNKLYGKLLQEEDGSFVLEVMGAFSGNPITNNTHQYDLIQGITTSSTQITLINVSIARFSGLITKYIFTEAFIGNHFYEKKSIVFDAISISLPHLDRWMGANSFAENREEHEIVLNYTIPETLSIRLTLINATVEIGFSYSQSGNFSEYNLKQRAFVKLCADSTAYFHELLISIRCITTFLSICYYQPIPIRYICFHKNSQEDVFYLPNEPIKYKEIEFPFLVSYQDIKQNLAQIFQWWFENKENLNVVGYLFQKLFEKSYDIPLELRFLQSIQAIEIFHRKFKNNEAIPKETIKPYRKYLKNLLKSKRETENIRNSILDRLSHAHEPSLKDRLTQLISDIPQNIQVQTIIIDKEFTANICKLRNYYTHWDKINNFDFQLQKIHDYTESLRLILIVSLLKEMQFTDDSIINIFERHKTMKFNRSLISPKYLQNIYIT